MKNLLVESEESLICEALVREIGKAKRWSAIIDAWQALLYVRLKAKELQKEYKKLHGAGENASSNKDKKEEEEDEKRILPRKSF